ncbi:MAG: TPM domain-containing protein [Candidatus Brocadiia bacterium]
MKRLLAICIFLLLGSLSLYGLDVPSAKGYVSDYAGLLSPSQTQSLDSMLRTHEQQTSNQVVVLIVKSLEGEPIERFGIKVAEKWKAGQKGKDNGVIFIIAKDDRQIRIEVGYGLEGVLTDLECALIIDNVVKPRFREGNYYQGIDEAIETIFESIKSEYAPAAKTSRSALYIFGCFILAVVWLIVILKFIAFLYRRDPWIISDILSDTSSGGSFGGSFGGGGGGFSGGGGSFGGGGASGSW